MKVTLILLRTIGMCLIAGNSALAAAPAPKRPNIIFILADDLGWRDTGYGGSELYRTPHIDAFARKGMVFTRAYAASPLCSPTRASVLTGLHPARIGITFPDCHYANVILEKGLDPKPDSLLKWIGAQSLTRLDNNYITLPEVLKTAGYATGHFGKWHLGNKPYDPHNQGFDEDFPQWSWVAGPGKYYAPWRWGVSGSADKGRPGENIEDRTMDEAIKFLAANRDRPFFLNYWAWSVHGPQQTSQELIEKYRSSITPGMAQRHPHYPGMIETLDNNVGRLLKAVEDLGLEKNTIIVFVSDNGGMHWNSRQVNPPTPSTSNAPLRAGKGTIYDGGTRVPCIVYWPGVTPHHASSDALISSIDWYPTLLDIVGLQPDPSQQPDGVSLVDVLRGKPLERKTIYCHFPQGEGWFMPGHQPSTYVRDGEWKLIRFYCDNPDQTDRYELYNIEIDPGERHDLAALFPDTVDRLKVLIDQFLTETQAVVPIPNPGYFRKKYPIPTIPSMATWRMDTGIVNLATAYTPFDVLVGLRSVGRQLDIMEDSVRFKIKDIAIHAARKNIGIVADLDPRMALPTFERRYPGELQQVIVIREMKKEELNDVGSVTIPSRTLRDHYHQPYQTRTGGFVKAYGYNLTRDGLIDGKSLRDISASIRTLSAGKEMVRMEYVPEKSHRFTETLLMVSFTYLYPDVFSPNLAAFQSDIFRKYAPLPLAGAHNDEWGFPASLTEPSLTNEYWYSPHMAAAYRNYTTDKRDLIDDIILMHKGIKGKEQERLKAFNLFGEFVRNRNAEIEEHFYNEVKKAYGPNGIVGVHPTWFPYPERREYKKNGLNWWVAKRDLAQTDEVVPFAIRTSLSKKWRSPVWYNMFYRYGLPEGATNADDYVEEVWSAALAGGRINNLPTVVQQRGLVGSDYMRAEARVKLLNYIGPAALHCPVAVLFGHAATMNPLTSAFEDPGMKLVNQLWQAGIATDLIPTSEIHNGSLTIDKDGYIRYGDQQYSTVILYNPEFEKAATASFFGRASAGNTRLFRVGNWTMGFDGRPYDGNGALPSGMIAPASDEVLIRSIKQLLAERGIPLQSPATRNVDGFGHTSFAPSSTGYSYLLDGTLVQVAASKHGEGDTLRSTMKIGSHTVTFDAIGVAAIRFDDRGHPEALAAGGLKSVIAPEMSLTLRERVDIALWKNKSGAWEGIVQGFDGDIPPPLLAITNCWNRVALPADYPSATRISIKKAFLPTRASASDAGEHISDIDGNTYAVMTLGGHAWMVENLRASRYNDGTPIDFAGSEKSGDLPGHDLERFYVFSTVKSGKLCPAGWRIPQVSEWHTLVDHLINADTAAVSFRPQAAGYMHAYGALMNSGKKGVWWAADTSRERAVWDPSSDALYVSESRALEGTYGFSVRCIRD